MSYLKRVGITSDFQRELPGVLEPICAEIFDRYNIAYEYFESPEVAESRQIDQFDAIIAYHVRFTSQSLRSIQRLAVISRWGVGFDTIDVEACNAAGVLVTIVSKEGLVKPVAEGILGLILCLCKGIIWKDQLVRQGRWIEKSTISAIDTRGKILGSIGIGDIGCELFRLVQPFGFRRLIASDPYADAARVADLGIELVELNTLLTESDILCINCPLTNETRGLIGEQELGRMKKTAFLINTARGPIVQESALIKSLAEGNLAGAALDVFESEPLEQSSPLLSLGNVILTPHSIALTEDLLRHNSLNSCQNALAVLMGEIPTTAINPAAARCRRFTAKVRRMLA